MCTPPSGACSVKEHGLKGLLHPSHGLAGQVGKSKKDEDRTAVAEVCVRGAPVACFAVYDGHGGAAAADLCAAELHGLVEAEAEAGAAGPIESTEAALSAAIVRACWALDGRLGAAGADAGTTATCLFVAERVAVIGFVGDSRGLRAESRPVRETRKRERSGTNV